MVTTAAPTCSDDRPARAVARPDGAAEDGAERRCIVTGARRDKDALIRFVVGPDHDIVPDLDGRLPGRGLWVTGERGSVDEAVRRRSFARAARAPVTASDDLADRVARMLVDRLIDAIALARRSGDAVCGHEKVRAVLRSGRASVLLSACDRQADGARKLRALARATQACVPIVDLLDAAQLGRPFGRAESVHAVVASGAMTSKVMGAADRLARYTSGAPAERIGGGDSEAR